MENGKFVYTVTDSDMESMNKSCTQYKLGMFNQNGNGDWVYSDKNSDKVHKPTRSTASNDTNCNLESNEGELKYKIDSLKEQKNNNDK